MKTSTILLCGALGVFAFARASAEAQSSAGNARKFLREAKPIAKSDNVSEEIASSALYRKTMVIIGDSYVANHRRPIEEAWHYRLAEKYQMNYFNYGFNGNALILPRKAKWREPVIERVGEMHEPADYVVVIAGHNDANGIGKPGAEEKFAEGLDSLVEKLRAKYPTAKIVFVSPWGVERNGFAEVLGAMRERLPKAGVFFYDAAKLSGINPNDKQGDKAALWQGPNDTAHLTAEGHSIMLEKMEPFFLSLQ